MNVCVEIAGLHGVSNGVRNAANLLQTTVQKEQEKQQSLRDTVKYEDSAFVWTVGGHLGDVYQSRENLYFGLQVGGKVCWCNFLKRGDHFPMTFTSGASAKIALGGAGHNWKVSTCATARF